MCFAYLFVRYILLSRFLFSLFLISSFPNFPRVRSFFSLIFRLFFFISRIFNFHTYLYIYRYDLFYHVHYILYSRTRGRGSEWRTFEKFEYYTARVYVCYIYLYTHIRRIIYTISVKRIRTSGRMNEKKKFFFDNNI